RADGDAPPRPAQSLRAAQGLDPRPGHHPRVDACVHRIARPARGGEDPLAGAHAGGLHRPGGVVGQARLTPGGPVARIGLPIEVVARPGGARCLQERRKPRSARPGAVNAGRGSRRSYAALCLARQWNVRRRRNPRMARPRPKPPIEVDAGALQPLGMPAADFLPDYWQTRPLLVRHAFPGFVSPIEPEDLAGLACEDMALSRLVRHDRARDAWTVRHGPFTEEEFPGLGDRDWTLLVQDVDKWDADIAALLSRFDFLPRWRIDDVMVSFAATGGSVGAHVDQYDVFLLQAQGHRRWQVDTRENPPLHFRKDAEIKLLQRFSPTHEWV